VRVALLVPQKAPTLPLPGELFMALREADLEETSAKVPVEKQNRRCARGASRKATEVAFRARERAYGRKKTWIWASRLGCGLRGGGAIFPGAPGDDA
jgi:hypothetical protein